MSAYFVQREECSHHVPFSGVEIFSMAGKEMMLCLVELEAHAVVEAHSHPQEQLGMLLQGEMTFTVGDEQRTLREGDMWRIPGGVIHRVVAGAEPVRALDIFHPVRTDYL